MPKSETLKGYEKGFKEGYKEGFKAAVTEIGKKLKEDADNEVAPRWPPSWWPW